MARKSIESNTLKSSGWIMKGKSKTLQKQKENTKKCTIKDVTAYREQKVARNWCIRDWRFTIRNR